uniref:Myb-like protein AA isoform X2 n=1 Tax=Dermatophagoides pteronyssinus TaxID=6956 RepID=A0A6P6YA76_DERPT|nr:myb-like protein AA isoform X2 [Dermatophagoides pteronyssinus]
MESNIFQIRNQYKHHHHDQQQQQQKLHDNHRKQRQPHQQSSKMFRKSNLSIQKNISGKSDSNTQQQQRTEMNTHQQQQSKKLENESITIMNNNNNNDSMDASSFYHELNIDPDQQQESLLQRQYNLYRYYLSQYPELFQEYFRQLRQQQQAESDKESSQQPIIVEPQIPQPSQIDDKTYQIQKLINNAGDNENVKETTKTTTNCCRLFCRCSKCCPTTSDSSWSDQYQQQQQSINDGDSQQKQHNNALYYLNANDLLEDERYEHLSRVITPPNAFLNSKRNNNSKSNSMKNDYAKNQIEIIDGNGYNFYTNANIVNDDQSQQQQQQSLLNTRFYSDKRTQTDSEELVNNGLLQSKSKPDTESMELSYQKVNHLSRNLKKQLSLIDTKSNQQQQQLHHQLSEPLKNHYNQQSKQQHGLDDHIYYTIHDSNRNNSNIVYPSLSTSSTSSSSATKQMNKIKNGNQIIANDKMANDNNASASKSFWNRVSSSKSSSDKQLNKLNENAKKSTDQQQPHQQQKLKNYIQAMYLEQDKLPEIHSNTNNNNTNDDLIQWSLMAGDDFDDDIFEMNKQPIVEHRIATTKNGIPCSCERCRESRGMNLTTELLPIDTQIPLQTMDNMDSFFQDSSMTELICMIQ